jgi:hypothetical protein
LELHHFYRAMAWLGENQEELSELDAVPRTTKDEIEEQLFDRRRDPVHSRVGGKDQFQRRGSSLFLTRTQS